MIIDHVSLGVADLDRARSFYDAALKPLGVKRLYDDRGMLGYGRGEHPELWFARPESGDRRGHGPSAGFHLCLHADSRPAVAAFHEAALGAGARDNGAPGLRPHYGPTYYGAFAIDPDGHHIEAVCHAPV
jgi:catechol 2,3-dioxygenase-like lactoylglutathione lyase family enzyme